MNVRSYNRSPQSPTRNKWVGCILLIVDIEGCNNVERRRFARELVDVVMQHTLLRPYLANDAKPECVCRTTVLERVLYLGSRWKGKETLIWQVLGPPFPLN